MKYVALTLAIFFLGCSDTSNTTLGNPLVSLKIAPYSAPMAMNKITPLAVSEIQFCVKRLRFKTELEETNIEPDDDEDNIDINLGLISINPSGTTITQVEVPPGEYTRIEFDLEPNCAGSISPSVYLDNDNDGGVPFETNDDITIEFNGLINLNSSTSINLYVEKIIAALDLVTDANDIEDALEDINNEGDFDEDND